jgi:hypothetical protein
VLARLSAAKSHEEVLGTMSYCVGRRRRRRRRRKRRMLRDKRACGQRMLR